MHRMKRPIWVVGIVLALALGATPMTATAEHDPEEAFPSTNEANQESGWAHVNLVSQDIGEVTLEFVSERSFASCFEYRTDGDTSEIIGGPVPGADTHETYPNHCENDSSSQMTFEADEYVEIRSAFGAESDERFNWTQFDVLPDAQTKDDCKNGGWEDYGFENQGQCIRYVQTGQDSRE